MPASCPGCPRCEGALHHYQSAVDSDGRAIWKCKHCHEKFDVLAMEPVEEPEECYGAEVSLVRCGEPRGRWVNVEVDEQYL